MATARFSSLVPEIKCDGNHVTAQARTLHSAGENIGIDVTKVGNNSFHGTSVREGSVQGFNVQINQSLSNKAGNPAAQELARDAVGVCNMVQSHPDGRMAAPETGQTAAKGIAHRGEALRSFIKPSFSP